MRYNKIITRLFAQIDAAPYAAIDLESMQLPHFITSDAKAMSKLRAQLQERVEQRLEADRANAHSQAFSSQAPRTTMASQASSSHGYSAGSEQNQSTSSRQYFEQPLAPGPVSSGSQSMRRNSRAWHSMTDQPPTQPPFQYFMSF